MHPHRLFVLALLGASVSVPAHAQDPAPRPGASAWKELFAGRDTRAWRGYRGDAFPAQGWVVADGALQLQAGGRGGDLVTAEEFADFELRFEWRVASGANSGVMYLVSEEPAAPWLSGPEYQILDDGGHADGAEPRTAAAALYALYPATGGQLRPTGEWNEGRIAVYRGTVEHWLNGTRVVRCAPASADFAARVAASKFAKVDGFAAARRGRIALQDHGDEVSFRNVRIRTLDPEAEVALFNGADFTGWTCCLPEGKQLADVWSVAADGVMVCQGEPPGYIRTVADYDNFVLTLEWRWDPVTKREGNSGVLVRMVGPDKVWPKSIEAQLMSGRAGDFWCIDDFPMQTEPARTSGRNTRHLAPNELPVGEWNRYEIEADHGRVELRVNGKVLNAAWECAELPGKICLQSEGAPIHFRDIRLLPIE